jgi:hypothetical protein
VSPAESHPVDPLGLPVKVMQELKKSTSSRVRGKRESEGRDIKALS